MHIYAQQRIAIIHTISATPLSRPPSEKHRTAVAGIGAQIHRPHSTPSSRRYPSTPLPNRRFSSVFAPHNRIRLPIGS